METTLESPVQFLPHVGPMMAKRLEKLGVFTVRDLLYYAPFRYDDYTLVSPIANIQPGETVTINGTVEWSKNFFTKRGKKIQQAKITDNTGSVLSVWFNQPFLANIIRKGLTVSLAGVVSWFGRQIVISSPSYEIINDETQGKSLHTGRFVPVYPETAGLSSKWLRARAAFAIEKFLPELHEHLPEKILSSYHLTDLQAAIQSIHFPQALEESTRAKQRLAFDELFFTQLQAQISRRQWEMSENAYQINISQDDIRSFIKTLPFSLTRDQENATGEIINDLTKPYPANRLLEGDVGAGKTVVAAITMYAVYKSGLRSVLMAPTEILASQHYDTIVKLLTPLGLSVGLMTGSRKDQKNETKNGKQNVLFVESAIKFDILVGTHALLSQSVDLDNTGFVVIDEQQRFGVRQRMLLRKKSEPGKTPHLLTMTATPIPRTIALTVYGNLDLSVLRTMPQGRKRIKTWIIPKEKRSDAYKWIMKQVKETRGQVFILCPLIDESESQTSVKAATAEYTKLKNGELKNARLELLHGRMKPDEKQKVLQNFRNREIDVLVTTPVVEVGIDIPNATVMMIEAADRFGLGQLHQLRGRVGRAEKESYCLLFTESTDELTIARLKALESIYSGPELAELDLKLRGPGEVFGTRQHGLPVFRFANFSDSTLISQTQQAAKHILTTDPELTNNPLLREKVKKATMEDTIQD